MENFSNKIQALIESVKQLGCNTCKHKGSVPGSAHSCCNHPVLEEVSGIGLEPLLIMAALKMNKNPLRIGVNFTDKDSGEKISVPIQEWNERGLEMGWVLYPVNFDPVWLEHCFMHSEIGNIRNKTDENIPDQIQ